jgi:hypothetical protein
MLKVVIIPDFKLYYKATAIKTKWHKNRYEDQWNRIEDPNMNHTAMSTLFLTKCTKNIQWKIASSTNVAGKNGYLPAEKRI